jgi:uncharacterized protein (UPF0332 family)
MNERPRDHLRAAQRKLRAARVLLADDLPEEAAAEAYFAMHSAARGALVETGHFAKSHRGTWSMFAQYFVKTGLVDKADYRAAQRAIELRQAADYFGGGASPEEAEVTITDAEAFITRASAAAGLELEDEGRPSPSRQKRGA